MNNTQEYKFIHISGIHCHFSVTTIIDSMEELQMEHFAEYAKCTFAELCTRACRRTHTLCCNNTMFAELWNLLHVLQNSARATCGAKYYKQNWSQFYLELQTSFSCSETGSCFCSCKTKIVATKCTLELWSSNCAFSGQWSNFSSTTLDDLNCVSDCQWHHTIPCQNYHTIRGAKPQLTTHIKKIYLICKIPSQAQ